jgi:hypothetical protein
MIWIAADINSQSQDVIARYNALLAPASLNDLYGGAIFNFDFPTLNSQMADPVIDDPGSLPSGTLHFSVTGSDVGTLAAVNEFDAWVFGDGADDPPLLLTQPVSIDGENYLRVWPDADVVAQFPPGTYRQIINIYSTTGEYGRTQQIVNVDVTP